MIELLSQHDDQLARFLEFPAANRGPEPFPEELLGVARREEGVSA
jgi:hypothetical protein